MNQLKPVIEELVEVSAKLERLEKKGTRKQWHENMERLRGILADLERLGGVKRWVTGKTSECAK